MDPGSLLFWLLAEMEMYEMGPDSRPNTKSVNPDLVRGDLRANGIGMPPGMAVKVKRTVNYRGSPTSTVSTSTNSSSTHFQKALIKFHLYDFASKSPTCTNSTNTILY